MGRMLCSTIVMTLIAVALNGCASVAGPRELHSIPGAHPPGASDWSRVIALRSATRVLVTVEGREPLVRRIVRADESSVTMLDLSRETVPGSVARVLLEMAQDRPESFLAITGGESFQQENIRIGRDGVFVASRKVAELDRIVESIARSAVIEVRGLTRPRDWSIVHPAPLRNEAPTNVQMVGCV